ncbi:MAG: hypothetical protein ABIJ41_00065 [Candidatus Omnitrophota bacterium]
MTKSEIYEHLARVYIGKSEKAEPQRRKRFNIKIFKQALLTIIFVTLSFYGLTAFLSHRNGSLDHQIIFALTNSPIRIPYNLNSPYPQIKSFSIPIPKTDALKYNELRFSVRALEEGTPGTMKIILRNRKNEASFYFIEGIDLKWKKVSIPLKQFEAITDWTNLSDVSFVLEAWNAKKKKGIILIDDVCFSG